MSIKLVMPSNHLILCRPLLLPPSIFPSIRVFSNESVLHIRWQSIWGPWLTVNHRFQIITPILPSLAIEQSSGDHFRAPVIGAREAISDPMVLPWSHSQSEAPNPSGIYQLRKFLIKWNSIQNTRHLLKLFSASSQLRSSTGTEARGQDVSGNI